MKFWIARGFSSSLNLFNNKPFLEYDAIYCVDGLRDAAIEIDENLFPEVTFENSPQEIEIKLKISE